tara:strand:+ start:5079 stop:5333 length:255 start_codon:yes stop_codon:yes gene_type:complete
MKIDAMKMGISVAIAFAVVWTVCSFMVWALPASMMNMTGHMVHMDLSGVAWNMSIGSAFLGLIAWSLAAGLTAWVVVATYNKLT